MSFFNGVANDPHNWVTFLRTAVDAGPNPEADAEMPGEVNGGTLLVHCKFTTATSVTYQVIYWNGHPKMLCAQPGPTRTATPANPTFKFDTLGSPLGILVTAYVGGGSVRFAMSRVSRKLGGS